MMYGNIDRKYGAIPFWFWNGEKTEEEITCKLEFATGASLRGMAVYAYHIRKNQKNDITVRIET